MSWVAASGWDTNETCEAGTSTIVALARSAMKRWSSGGIALSSVPSKYQHGRCVPRWRSRWRCCERGGRVWPLRRRHHGGRLRIDIGCERLSECLGGEVKVGALAAVWVGKRDGPDRRPHKAAFELLEEKLLALAYVAHPAVELDERLDLSVVDGGGGDDIAAVRVAGEHDRTAQSAQELGEIGGVPSEIAKRVAEPDDGVPAATQGAARISASKPVASAQAP
jgi:hypothetical protein